MKLIWFYCAQHIKYQSGCSVHPFPVMAVFYSKIAIFHMFDTKCRNEYDTILQNLYENPQISSYLFELYQLSTNPFEILCTTHQILKWNECASFSCGRVCLMQNVKMNMIQFCKIWLREGLKKKLF